MIGPDYVQLMRLLRAIVAASRPVDQNWLRLTCLALSHAYALGLALTLLLLVLQHVVRLLNSLGSVLHGLDDLVREALILAALHLELWLLVGSSSFDAAVIFETSRSRNMLQFALLLLLGHCIDSVMIDLKQVLCQAAIARTHLNSACLDGSLGKGDRISHRLSIGRCTCTVRYL